MSTIRHGYSARIARGDSFVNGVVVQAPVLTEEDLAVIRGLVRRKYPHDAQAVVASLIERGLLEASPNPRGGMPLLAITSAGFRALRAAS